MQAAVVGPHVVVGDSGERMIGTIPDGVTTLAIPPRLAVEVALIGGQGPLEMEGGRKTRTCESSMRGGSRLFLLPTDPNTISRFAPGFLISTLVFPKYFSICIISLTASGICTVRLLREIQGR